MGSTSSDDRDRTAAGPVARDEFEVSRQGRRLGRRVASASIALWGSVAFSMLGTIIAARALGPGGYGEVVLALATASMIAYLLDLTLEQGLVHHGTAAVTKRDLGGLRALVRVGFAIDLGIGLLVSGLMFALAAPIAEVATGGQLAPIMMQLAALNVLVTTLNSTTGAVLLVADRAVLKAWGMAGMNLGHLVGMAAAVFAFGTPQAVLFGYVAGSAVGSILQALLAWGAGWRHWRGPHDRTQIRQSVRRLLPFAVHSSLQTTILSAGDSLIYILVGRLSGADAVGLLRIALLPQTVANLATGPVRLVMFPEKARAFAAGRIDELRQLLFRWSAVGVAIALPAAVAGFFLLPWLLPTLYGAEFTDAVLASQIILPLAVVAFGFPWTKNFAAVIGRPGIASALSVIMLLVAVPITVLFGTHGPEAGAAGLSSGVVVMTAGYLLVARGYFRRHRQRPAAAVDEARLLDASGAMPTGRREPGTVTSPTD